MLGSAEEFSAPGKQQFSVSASISRFWARGLPCDLSYLMDLRRGVVVLQFFQHLSCEIGSDDFQELYLPDRKPET